MAEELFETLLLRYLDRTASDEDHAELERRLQADPAARDRFVQLALAQAQLPRMLRAARGRRRALQAGLVAAAMVVALVGGYAVLAWRTPRPSPVGVLAAAPLLHPATSATVRRADGGTRVDGDLALRVGDAVALDQGAGAEVIWADGTTIRLAAGSLARWQGDAQGKRFELTTGSADLTVAKQPADAPLVLQTPAAAVTVVGTTLRVDAGADATTVQVTTGTVAVERRADQARVRLEAGQRCSVVADQPLAAETAGAAVEPLDDLSHRDDQRWFALAGGGARMAITAAPGPLAASAAAMTVDATGPADPATPGNWPWAAFTVQLATPGDWSRVRTLAFWFRGTGDGRDVRIELNGARPPGGGLGDCPRYITIFPDSSSRWRRILLPIAGFTPRQDMPVPAPAAWDRKQVNAVSLVVTPARAGTWAWAGLEVIR